MGSTIQWVLAEVKVKVEGIHYKNVLRLLSANTVDVASYPDRTHSSLHLIIWPLKKFLNSTVGLASRSLAVEHGQTLKDYHQCLTAEYLIPPTHFCLSSLAFSLSFFSWSLFVNKINIYVRMSMERGIWNKIQFREASYNAICVFDHLFQSQKEFFLEIDSWKICSSDLKIRTLMLALFILALCLPLSNNKSFYYK